MKIVMNIALVGAVSISPGDVYACDAAEGERLVAAEYASPAPDDAEITIIQPGYDATGDAPKKGKKA